MSRSILPSLFGGDRKSRPVFQNLHDEIDRVFDEFRDTFSDFGDRFDRKQKGMLMPRIDVSESQGTIEISAELPGLAEDDVEVTVVDQSLVIKGEKSEEREEKDKDYHLVECSRGSYLRSVPLGFDVEDGEVNASIKDGVLRVVVNKPAEIAEKTRKIPITKAA